MNISSTLAMPMVAALVFTALPAQAQPCREGWNAPCPVNFGGHLDWQDRQRCYDNAWKSNIDAGAAIGAIAIDRSPTTIAGCRTALQSIPQL